jgi:hypothetical protein
MSADVSRDEALGVLLANLAAVCPALGAVTTEDTLSGLGLSSLDRLDVLVGALDDLGLPPTVDVLSGADTLGGLAAALAGVVAGAA